MRRKAAAIAQIALFYALIFYFGPSEIRTAPNLYILCVVGVLAIIYQPGFSVFDGGSQKDCGTALQILWTIQITQFLGHVEAVFWRYPESFQWTLIAWIGLVSTLAGLGLRTWAVLHLGKAFTWHINPDAADQLITNGPFAVFRHPSYVGAFFLYMGAIVFLQAYATLIVALIAIPMAFVRRIKLEEEALEAKFGSAYTQYKSRVGAVLPRLPWRI